MITIFSSIPNSRKIELKELILFELKKYKESFEYKDHIKSNYNFQIAKTQMKDICFKRLNRNFNQNEKNYMFMYILTDDDSQFLEVCKRNRISEPYKPFKYDFEKIGVYYGVSEKIAKLRYKMVLENFRLKDKYNIYTTNENEYENNDNQKTLTKKNNGKC